MALACLPGCSCYRCIATLRERCEALEGDLDRQSEIAAKAVLAMGQRDALQEEVEQLRKHLKLLFETSCDMDGYCQLAAEIEDVKRIMKEEKA